MLGTIDPTPLQNFVKDIGPQLWEQDKTRQTIYDAHKSTNTIPVIHNSPERHLDPVGMPILKSMVPMLRPLVEMISTAYSWEGWISRAILTRLPPGEEILTHVDSGFSLEHSHRVHMPILSGDQVTFSVGGEKKVMAPGELWEINNLRAHSVKNGGTSDRVHLILDWAAPFSHQSLEKYYHLVQKLMSESKQAAPPEAQ